jgi:hypothetical protein
MSISLHVSLEFRRPILSIRRRLSAMNGATVPETTTDEDRELVLREHNVGPDDPAAGAVARFSAPKGSHTHRSRRRRITVCDGIAVPTRRESQTNVFDQLLVSPALTEKQLVTKPSINWRAAGLASTQQTGDSH